MAWFVLTVRTTDHGAPTVCAVKADRWDRGETTSIWWLGDQIVYTAPTLRVLHATEHSGQIEAQATIRARQFDLREKGLQGPEYHGLRPALGATPVRAAMIERVVTRLVGQSDAKDSKERPA